MSWLLGFGYCLLAQAAAPAADAPKAEPLQQFLNLGPLIPMIPIAILFYFLILRPQSQDQKKREQLLNALKKNDRVVTIGGILGTVANISADGSEVTLKVDDNTRIRVLRTGIQTKLGSDENSESAS
ncbi:MAG: preprotein translocase subunit YajC [Planctomycetales bacterium]